MNFNQSKDGIPRASISIRFRVGTALLHAAAADIVWTQLVDDNAVNRVEEVEETAERLASKLTRASIVRQLRRSLQANGYEWGGTDDEWWQIAHDATEPVIERLWPDEVAATRQAAPQS